MVMVWTTGVLCRVTHQLSMLVVLLAGIVFGPAFLGLIAPNEMLQIMTELGEFFLMFYAGLKPSGSEKIPTSINPGRHLRFCC